MQYEFTALHLDDCLERLGHHESDELAVQISAYVDNEFNVAELMEEAELKGQAMEQVDFCNGYKKSSQPWVGFGV